MAPAAGAESPDPQIAELTNMILTFTTHELQLILGFAGRNKQGAKGELQSRAIELVRLRSTPLQTKIRELYQSSLNVQSAVEATPPRDTMMGQGGQPINFPGMNYNNMTAAAMMNAAYSGQQAAMQGRGRNPYIPGSGGQTQQTAAAYGANANAANANMYNNAYQVQPARQVPVHPDVKFVKLPFYDIHAELLRPASLLAAGNNRFQDAQFQFFLSPGQATDIASNRDIRMGAKMEYLYQIQLRFVPLSLELGKEMADEFPPSVCVQVNGKMAQLPNPIPTNKPGVEPKRPPRPVNITPMCKLSPILPNQVNVKWAAEYGKGWVVGIWLVMKLTSTDLLDRMKKKGTREKEYTKQIIIDKLRGDDDVGVTELKVTLACPLGKMRMMVPCRASTCVHLQCFDASLFLQMNERKPTWSCPVCDSKALYDNLLIDGYFEDVIADKKLPMDENDIILEEDGSWKPKPKEDEKEKAKAAAAAKARAGEANGEGSSREGSANGEAGKPADAEVDCIDLSDDDTNDAPASGDRPPPPPPPPPQPQSFFQPAEPLPPPPPQEVECIDLD